MHQGRVVSTIRSIPVRTSPTAQENIVPESQVLKSAKEIEKKSQEMFDLIQKPALTKEQKLDAYDRFNREHMFALLRLQDSKEPAVIKTLLDISQKLVAAKDSAENYTAPGYVPKGSTRPVRTLTGVTVPHSAFEGAVPEI